MEKKLAQELLLALAGNPAIPGTSLRAAFQAGVSAWHEHFPEDRPAGSNPGPKATSGTMRGPGVESPGKSKRGTASAPSKDDAFRAWQAIRVSKGLPADSRSDFESDLACGAHNLTELLAFLEA